LFDGVLISLWFVTRGCAVSSSKERRNRTFPLSTLFRSSDERSFAESNNEKYRAYALLSSGEQSSFGLHSFHAVESHSFLMISNNKLALSPWQKESRKDGDGGDHHFHHSQVDACVY
jgi:hypothetical protein